jgi:hypothetical protein
MPSMSRTTPRIVITGMGWVTPLGHDLATVWGRLMRSESGMAPIDRFDARTFPTTFAAQVRDFDVTRFVEDSAMHATAGLNTCFALGAARQAWEQAGLSSFAGLNRRRAGIYLGAGEGVLDTEHYVAANMGRLGSGRTANRWQALGRRSAPRDDRAARDRTGAEHARLAPRPRVRLAWPKLQLPYGMRREHAGDRRGVHDPEARRHRPHARWRNAHDDPHAWDHRLQPTHGALDEQGRSDEGQPTLRPRARWLRDGRRKRHGDFSRRSTMRSLAERSPLRRCLVMDRAPTHSASPTSSPRAAALRRR